MRSPRLSSRIKQIQANGQGFKIYEKSNPFLGYISHTPYAPLNFRLEIPAEVCYAKVEGAGPEVMECYGTDQIRFHPAEWSRWMMANRGKSLSVTNDMTYPYWHPSGHYITTSVNDIRQFFHSVKERKMEVFKLESDVVVYDVRNKEILSKTSLITKDAFETFPSFSHLSRLALLKSRQDYDLPPSINAFWSLCFL